MPHHNPTDYGLKEDNGRLIPVWTTLSEAKKVFHVDILCFCKQNLFLFAVQMHEGKLEMQPPLQMSVENVNLLHLPD